MVTKARGKDIVHDNPILVDSDAFIGRFFTDDVHHRHASERFEHFERSQRLLTTTSAVIGETATVLSHRRGQALALRFLDIIERSQMSIIHIDLSLHLKALALFKQQTDRGTSYTDCANVAVMQQFSIPVIFSFDQVYIKRFKLQTA